MAMKNKVRVAVVSIAALVLTACGGGGGSASSGSTTTALAALTTSNAQTASAAATNSANTAVGGGQMGNTALAYAVVTGSQGQNLNLSAVARAVVAKLQDNAAQLTSGTLAGVVVQKTVPCDVGTVNVSWNDADNSGNLSSGDTFTMTFNSCTINSLSTTINGTLGLTQLVLTGTPGVTTAWSIAADFSFNNVSVQQGSTAGRLDGDMAFRLSTSDSITDSGSVSGSSLTVVQNGRTATLSGYRINYTEDTNTAAYTLSIDGNVYDSKLGGTVQVTTTQAFSGTDITAGTPDTGSLTITGANNTSVMLTAQGGGNVQLQIDSNGDGQVDSVVNTTYNQLSSL